MAQRRKKTMVIPAEKMALLAEKGLKAARLSSAELLALASGGLSELHTIKEGLKGPSPLLGGELIDKVMAAYFPAASSDTPAPFLKDISVFLTKKAVTLVTATLDWQLNSPAFAQRGPDSGTISFSKGAGKFTIHLEVTKSGGRGAGINVRLTGKSKQEHTSFEATLLQDGRLIECIHGADNPVASFSNISPGDYSLKVSGNKNEIASVNIRLED